MDCISKIAKPEVCQNGRASRSGYWYIALSKNGKPDAPSKWQGCEIMLTGIQGYVEEGRTGAYLGMYYQGICRVILGKRFIGHISTQFPTSFTENLSKGLKIICLETDTGLDEQRAPFPLRKGWG